MQIVKCTNNKKYTTSSAGVLFLQMLKTGRNLRDGTICGQGKNWRVTEEKRLPTKLAKMAVAQRVNNRTYEYLKTHMKLNAHYSSVSCLIKGSMVTLLRFSL